LTEIARCSRCGAGYYRYHGNQKLCGSCRTSRRAAGRTFGRVSFGLRRCDLCGREFMAHAAHARYCSRRCCDLARKPVDAKYARPEHRRKRAILRPAVASGRVRCARGRYCKFSEYVDGELVGGLIKPGEPWHLGHADQESAGGAEHRACNTGAPSRLRAKLRTA
jgi:hypothetical protein